MLKFPPLRLRVRYTHLQNLRARICVTGRAATATVFARTYTQLVSSRVPDSSYRYSLVCFHYSDITRRNMSTEALPATIKAVRVHEFGGPEKLELDDIPLPTVSPTQVLVRIHYSGINYIDTYHRTGLYPNALPLTVGRECAGVVAKIGDGVAASSNPFQVGDRVALFTQGTYAEYVAVEAVAPLAPIIRVPDAISFKVAAAAMLQGLTAHYLTDTSYCIKQGDHVLIHAAAGGTGSLVVQMAKKRGAIVIGTVGSAAKAEVVRALGCDHVILYNDVDFVTEVRKIVPEGVRAVYDGVGLATYEKSMKCLGKIGTLVLFGNASGAVPPINPLTLTSHGSLFLTRPSLIDHLATREAFVHRTGELFKWIQDGSVKITIAKVFPLTEAAESHRALESRQLSGKLLIKVHDDEE